MRCSRLAVLLVGLCAAAVAGAPTRTLSVRLHLRTGGVVSGPVVDHTRHGLVVVQDDTPYVFAWNELTTNSAMTTRRSLLAFERGGADRLSAEDHYALGRFALWVGREDIAAGEFSQAGAVDADFGALGRAAIERYHRQNEEREGTPHPLASPASVSKHDDGSSSNTGPAESGVTSGDAIVPGPSPQRRSAVREAYETFGRKVQEVLGTEVARVESDHFLLWTDWREAHRERLADWCDAMYVALCRQFGLDPSEDIFLAKCPLYCFRSKQRFQKFAQYFDGYDGSESIGYSRSIEANGHVHVVILRQGRHEADFDRAACTLVHEGTHAFLHRLYGSRLLPPWVNEGLADLTAERVLGDRCPAGENAALLARQYVRHDWPMAGMLESVEPLAVHQYGVAHSVVAHLERLGRARLQGFIKGLKTGGDVPASLGASYDGLTVAGLENGWRAWIRESDPASPRPSASAGAPKPLFRERREVRGVHYGNICGAPAQIPILEQNGQGVGVIDFDNDGLMDLFVPNGSTEARWRKDRNPGCQLYRNLGGWRFVDVTEKAGVKGNAWSNGISVADYDGDGDFDLYVLNWGANVLYRNDGDGRFTDVTAEAGVGKTGWSSSAAFADFNGDGRLDLYVSNYVHFDYDDYPRREKNGQPCMYRDIETGCGPWCYAGERDTVYFATGGGRFEDRTAAAGVGRTDGYRGFGVVAADFDDDGDADVYVGCDVMPNLYLENVGGGRFESVGLSKGGAYNESGGHESGMGVAAADFDRSGTLDLFVTNFSGEKNTCYRNEGGRLTDVSAVVGLREPRLPMGWGVLAKDFNADGRLDLFVANGHIYPQVEKLADPRDRYRQTPLVYLQKEEGRLVLLDDGEAMGASPRYSLRGAASADLDNDGDLDVVAVQHNGPLVFFENLSVRKRVTIELVDARGGRSPMGARLSVTGGGTYWHLPNQSYQSSNDHRIHVAVPVSRSPLEIEVRWPNGEAQAYRVDSGSEGVVRLRQGAGK